MHWFGCEMGWVYVLGWEYMLCWLFMLGWVCVGWGAHRGLDLCSRCVEGWGGDLKAVAWRQRAGSTAPEECAVGELWGLEQ